jgi:hypothetical protein
MMRQQLKRGDEPPQVKREIIPPGDRGAASTRIWVSSGEHRSVRIHLVQPGPFGIALSVLLIGVVLAAALVLMAGAALVGILVAGALIFGAMIASVLHRLLRR